MESIKVAPAEQEPEFLIELATTDDAASIAHIQKETWLATYPNEEHGITPEDILSKDFESEERLKKRVERLENEDELSQTWVVREGEQVVGYSSAAKGEEVNRITSIYLLPEYQGKGIGSRLFQQALDWLGDDKDITLGVVSYNDSAIAFYEKFGFVLGNKVEHEEPTFSTGKDMPEVEMIKPRLKEATQEQSPAGTTRDRIQFKNEPKLSEFEAQATFNERRQKLVPQVKELITSSTLFEERNVTAEFAHTGVSSLVCFLESEGDRFVLKVPLSLTDGNGEARFLREWEAAGVKVPHIMEDGQLGEHPYLIMEFVDAPALQSLVKHDQQPDETWRDMGKILSRMHTPVAEGFGRIVEGKPEYENFEDWLLGPGIEKRVRTVRKLGLLGDEHGRIDKVFGALLAHTDNQDSSTLCHFDFTPNNILATKPLTVFDPSPMLNHGIIDIGRSMLSCLFHGRQEAMDEMRDGYFGEAEYNQSALQASIILNAYWKFPYQHKTDRTAEISRVREYLEQTAHLL